MRVPRGPRRSLGLLAGLVAGLCLVAPGQVEIARTAPDGAPEIPERPIARATPTPTPRATKPPLADLKPARPTLRPIDPVEEAPDPTEPSASPGDPRPTTRPVQP